MVARWLTLALLTSGIVLVQNTTQNEPVRAAAAQCIEFSHSSVFYYDTKQAGPNTRNFDAKYLGFKITPTDSANVKVEVTDFTDNNKFNVRLASGQPTSQTVGLATSTSPKMSYFLTELYANSGGGNESLADYKSSPIETFTVTVKDASTNAVLCSRTQSLTVADQTLAANANKIYSSRVSTPSTEVGTGSMVVITVTGNTGTVGAGPDGKYDVNFTPVADPSKFAPAAWELKKIEYKGLNSNCTKITDQLYFDKNKTPSSIVCSGNYAVSYLFEVRASYSGSEGSFSEIQSFIYGASGNLIKHTTPPATTIKLPKANSSSTVKPTVDPTNLDQYLNEAIADLPFTVGNLELRTVKGTPGNPVNSSTPTYVNASGSPEIQWDKMCLVSGSSCVTNSAITTTGGSWSIVSGPSGAKLLRFTPDSAYETANPDDPADVVVFRLTDGNNQSATASATAIVDPSGFIAQDVYFKTPPGAASSSATLSATGGTINWDATRLIDSASSEVTSVTIPGEGVWTIAGSSGQSRALTFTPEANFSGTSFVQFKLTSSGGGTSFATGYATTDPRPTVNSQSASVTMGSSGAVTTLSPTVTPSDVASRCIYASEASSASCGNSLTATSISWTLESNGKVTFVSQFGFTGSATISYKVTDSSGNSGTNSMTVTVNPPAAPTITAETGTTSTSKPVTLSPTVTSTLTTTICLINPADTSSCSNEVTVPGKGTWKKNSNGTITFTSVDSFTGSATISARVTDQINQTGTGTQTVNVNAPTAPAVSSPSGTTAVNTAITASVVVTSELPISTKCLVDPADPTSCSNTVVIAGKGTFTRVGDQVRFNAGANTGSATVSFRAVDSLGRTAHGTVSITITDDPNFNANAVPVPTTSAATNVTQTTARINGNVQSGNVTTNITFCYGLQATLVGCTTVTATPAQISGGASGAVYYDLTGLTGSTTYWFRVIATDSNPYYGATLSFTTTAAPSNNPTPEPAPTSDPCEPGVTTSSLEPGLYSKLIGYLVKLFGTAGSWSSSFFGGVVQSPIADALVATMAPNPLLTQAGYDALTQTKLSIVLQAAAAKAAPKTVTPQEQLTQEEVVLQPGPNPGEVEITTTDGDPLSVLAVSPEDPFFSTQFSGSDFNKPEVWEFLGYGQLCWKLEPFGETDLSYVLPNPIKLPAGTAAGDWRYSNVIVKAGALTARSDTYQTDTIFPAPAPGSVVWPDVNANGVFDAGGRGGDKAISHIIFCVTKGTTATQSAQATKSPSVTASPTPSTTSTSPSPTQTSTATPTPTSSGTNTATPTPTQTSTQTPTPSSSTPAPSQTTQTPTPTQTSTPTPTATANCPIPTSSATVAPREPKPTETPKVIFKLNTPSPTPTPTTTQTSTPTPTQTSTQTPSPTPSSSATQTPSPSATPSPSNSVTPSPTQTPTPTQTSTPSPTQTSTPTPSASTTSAPTPTQTNTPSPTSTAPAPTSTATPSPTFTYTPTFTPLGEKLCEPNQPNGVAMVLSNGVDRLCYQTTTFAFFNAASFVTSGLDSDGVDELADTGFNVELWLFVASLLGLAGALLLGIARFGRKN